eukprot:5217809-Prymnesium_polylepis.2
MPRETWPRKDDRACGRPSRTRGCGPSRRPNYGPPITSSDLICCPSIAMLSAASMMSASATALATAPVVPQRAVRAQMPRMAFIDTL